MARMSIDDKVGRDPRVTVLAELLGWSRRETVGCLVTEVWPICYDQETHLISERIIDTAAGRVGFAAALIEAELATRDRSGKVSIGGAKERIQYLNHKRIAGREGGLNSGKSRGKQPKQTPPASLSNRGSTPQAAGNPPVPDMDMVPVPDSAPVPAKDPAPEEKRASAPPRRPPTGPQAEAVREFAAYFERATGSLPTFDKQHYVQFAALVSKQGLPEIIRRISVLEQSPPPWPQGTWDPATFLKHFDKIAKSSRPLTPLEAQMERVRMLEAQQAAEQGDPDESA